MQTPWHLWVVGIFALLFNAGGAYDYVMTQTQNPAYMSQFSEAERTYFYSFPAWVQGAWALAVWSAVLGAMLMLLRSRWAASAFAVSLIAMAVTFTHNFCLADQKLYEVTGQEAVWFTAVIVVVTMFFFFYSRAMSKLGVLQ